ncbi:tRNA threonylcarbamoyladenosine dehydratase [Eremococcus coleocola]|uniref:tRNA threonylcarbamoyladenosine dehydratase n=1 Tax=Eremococcus coleocola TaxID=88132 RepID=UPI00041D93EE|nr:tRNA threonylcarbamoyladenosine dehydratase [Eremococcus coleocola]
MDIKSERLDRLRLLLNNEGLRDLAKARVMVLGLGGVGSACAIALARGGVGQLILVDRDRIERSNINRQALAFESTLGRLKVEVMSDIIKDINPDCQLESMAAFLHKDNINELLGQFGRPDYVIDCIDTVSPKLTIAQWCQSQDLPLLAAMGAANKLDPSYLKFDFIEHTTYCPLSKVMRRECRKRDIKNLEVLYSNEIPFKVSNPQGREKGATLGSMSYMPPIMGQMLAGKVIRRLTKLEAMPKGTR